MHLHVEGRVVGGEGKFWGVWVWCWFSLFGGREGRGFMTEAERAEAYRALVEQIKLEIPGFKIAYKDDSPEEMPWWHRVVHGLGRRIVPGYDRNFTTVIAPVVYLPVGRRGVYGERPWEWYETMRHEFVHLRDARDYPLWMPLSYLCFPLPVGWTARGFWELRGYTQTMLVRWEGGMGLGGVFMERLVEIFSGRDYGWMVWPRGGARRVLEHMRGRIERGEVEGLSPRVEVWRDFVGPLLGIGGG